MLWGLLHAYYTPWCAPCAELTVRFLSIGALRRLPEDVIAYTSLLELISTTSGWANLHLLQVAQGLGQGQR